MTRKIMPFFVDAPSSGDCRALDPLDVCPLVVTTVKATLEHARLCSDLELIEHAMFGAAIPYLKKALWRGFLALICKQIDIPLVLSTEPDP